MQGKKDEICPHCKRVNSLRHDFARGEIVCKECYTVIEDRIIDKSSEWRNFAAEFSSHSSDPNRVGGPLDEFMEDSGMTTKIIAKGTHTGLTKAAQKSAQDAGDKSLMRGFNVIKDFADQLHLPSEIVEKSKGLFKNIEKKKKLKGRNLDSVIAAVLYVSAKQCSNPKNLKDVITKTGTKKKDVVRCIGLVRQFSNTGGENIEQMVQNLCNKLNVGNKVRNSSIEVVRNIDQFEYLGGKNPYTKASVAICLVAKALAPDITPETVADQAKLSASTIKSSLKEIMTWRYKLLPADLANSPVYSEDKK